MTNENVQFFVVYDKFQTTKIIATVGVSGDEVVCIAYHYDPKDQNLDGKKSFGERFSLNQQAARDLHIANSLAIQGAAFDTDLIKRSIKAILSSGAETAVSATQYAYFQILVGIPIGQLLTAAGVTGIKKLIYSTVAKSLLRGIVL